MGELFFHVAACAAWSPGRESWADWCAWAGAETSVATVDESIAAPVGLRRRVGAIGQKALKAAWALPQARDGRYVFASRHGEFERTIQMLRDIAQGEAPSPAEFSLSVHNALAGLLSIATANRVGHTTVAAGPESFCAALLEAAAGLAEDPTRSSVVAFYDVPLSAPYDELMQDEPDYREPLAVVMALTPGSAGDRRIALRLAPADVATERSASPALEFLAFLLKGTQSGAVRGARHNWCWRHV